MNVPILIKLLCTFSCAIDYCLFVDSMELELRESVAQVCESIASVLDTNKWDKSQKLIQSVLEMICCV